LPSRSVILPTKVLTRQLYERNGGRMHTGRPAADRMSTSYIPSRALHGREPVRHHPIHNVDDMQSSRPSSAQTKVGLDNVQSYLHAQRIAISRPQQPRLSSGLSPMLSPARDMLSPWNAVGQVPEVCRGFSAVSPRSRGSAGARGTASRGLKLHLALPKGPDASGLNTSNLSSPRSRPPSARLPFSRTASADSGDRDALIEASRRVLARENREQLQHQQLKTSPRNRAQGPAKMASAPALEVLAWPSPQQKRSMDLANIEFNPPTGIPESYAAYTEYTEYI
jgi:hypothetical protein